MHWDQVLDWVDTEMSRPIDDVLRGFADEFGWELSEPMKLRRGVPGIVPSDTQEGPEGIQVIQARMDSGEGEWIFVVRRPTGGFDGSAHIWKWWVFSGDAEGVLGLALEEYPHQEAGNISTWVSASRGKAVATRTPMATDLALPALGMQDLGIDRWLAESVRALFEAVAALDAIQEEEEKIDAAMRTRESTEPPPSTQLRQTMGDEKRVRGRERGRLVSSRVKALKSEFQKPGRDPA